MEASADGGFSVGPQIAAIQRRAIAYELDGKLKAAMADYATLIAIVPDLSFTVFNALSNEARRKVGAAGTLRTVLGYRSVPVHAETDRLIEQREKAFRDGMSKTWYWAHVRRGACAFGLDDFETAIAESSEAIALGNSDAWVHQLRAAAHARAGHRDDALKDFTVAIEIEPGNAVLHYDRALAGLTSGAAIRKPQDGSDYRVLEAQVRPGELKQIEADFRKVLEIDPSHEMARTLLDALVKSQGSRG